MAPGNTIVIVEVVTPADIVLWAAHTPALAAVDKDTLFPPPGSLLAAEEAGSPLDRADKAAPLAGKVDNTAALVVGMADILTASERSS